MRRVLYRVAASLDGFIAGPNGEIDWIVPDPTVDFVSLYAGVDTVLIGRRTYEMTLQPGAPPWPADWRIYVFSQTLDAAQHAGVTVVSGNIGATVAALRSEPGRDIWLFGGGAMFRSLLDAGLVDTVEVAVVPVLLGAGVPLLPPGATTKLTLTDQKTLPDSGILALAYSVPGGIGPAPRIGYIKPAKTRVKGRRTARKSSSRKASKKRRPS
jgi:dihydrofolate reductase